MAELIQLLNENAYLILSIIISLGGWLIVFLRGKLRDVGNEVLIGMKLLRDAIDKRGPKGKDLSDEEQQLLAAQALRILEKAVGDRLRNWLRTLIGIKEPTEKEIYNNG